jgi:NTE family protein
LPAVTEMNAPINILNVEPAVRWVDSTTQAAPSSQVSPKTLGHLATLAFLSRRIPAENISRQIVQALAVETGGAVLLVVLTPGEAPLSLAEWDRVTPPTNGEFRFAGYLDATQGHPKLTIHCSFGSDEAASLGSMLTHFREHFAAVVVQLFPEALPAGLADCLLRANSPFLFFRHAPEELAKLDELIRAARSFAAFGPTRFKPVLFLEADEPAHGLLDLLKRSLLPASPSADQIEVPIGVDDLRYLRDGKEAFGRQIRSLAREITGSRIGLALSSGGARGLAHIGVIQVLEENGIEVDAVAGCSMGAYVAALWAFGHDGQKLEQLARETESRWGLLKLVDPVLPPRRGFMLGNAVIHRLKRSIGNAHFSDMERTLRIVATNFHTLERVVFSSGEVASAVHASIAIPGVCAPVTIDDETYVDGGVTDPLPVDVLKEMGIERIIAVNTLPTPAYLQCCRERELEQADVRGRRNRLVRFLNRNLNYFARGNILDVMMRAVHGAQIRVAEQFCRQADVLLRPLACDSRWHDFTHPRKYIALGRQVAGEQVDKMKALVKGVSHENRPAQRKMAVAA